ncbi:hypothetical protein ACFVWN_01395 [Nocardiopsis flavescens]|uniref:hypothetical protein n=1 Tax=Nocardiopsis flavescens TaxID=758803 RepID=UPI003657B8B1
MTTPPSAPALDELLGLARRIADTIGTTLDQKAYMLDEATRRHQQPGVCWRVEARTRISDPGDRVLCRWHSGQRTRAVNELAGEQEALAARHRMYRSQFLDVRTLWATRLPLDAHTTFLAHAFRVQAHSGFPVWVTDLDRDVVGDHSDLPSLVAYPGRCTYLLHHTEQGRPTGATRIDDPKLTTAITDHIENRARRGESITAFTARCL